jgi:hypothetical protein
MKVKPLTPKIAEIKYIGSEPSWENSTDQNRKERLVAAFNWYNYNYGKKEAKEMILDWLKHNNRVAEHKEIQKVSDSEIRITVGWLCRCSLMGLELLATEKELIEIEIASHSEKKPEPKIKELDQRTQKPNIQDRLREKMSECAAELEGMYDEFIFNKCKNLEQYSPIAQIRALNVSPNFIGEIKKLWQKRLEEITAINTDKYVQESYSCYKKMELRNMIRFCESVITDCDSYVQVKKVERKPRAKKPVSAEKTASKIQYLKEIPELKLKSDSPSKIVNSSEVWLYDSSKRKLLYYVADSHVGKMTVKGSGIIGFDPTLSSQKTIRKPDVFMQEFLKSGKVQMRKLYKALNTTEVKVSGRVNDKTLIVKVY